MGGERGRGWGWGWGWLAGAESGAGRPLARTCERRGIVMLAGRPSHLRLFARFDTGRNRNNGNAAAGRKQLRAITLRPQDQQTLPNSLKLKLQLSNSNSNSN